jgi:23S rRNA (pseudouridine1915-N3)-methyltransferase
VRVRLVVVGRPRHAGLAAAIADYEERAGHYWPLDVREVKEEPGRSRSPDEVKAREWTRLADASTGARLVACEAGGRAFTSEAFASWLDDARTAATDVAFVIGGAHGLPPAAAKGAELSLSLGTWTLPHELARLVLVEQLYRAGTILRGEPYHK